MSMPSWQTSVASGQRPSRCTQPALTCRMPFSLGWVAPRTRGERCCRIEAASLAQATADRACNGSLGRDYGDANFPMDAEGRTYHLGTKKGEVANRILSVGSVARARMLAELLEPPKPGCQLLQVESSRGFLTVTGRFRGVPVSLVATLMGMPNMDFVVRECRAVVDGEMAIVRLGTCGGIQPPAALGSLVVCEDGAVCVRRNPDAFGHAGAGGSGHGLPYHISSPVPADAQLSACLAREAQLLLPPSSQVLCGMNVSADSFYSSQGRSGSHFDDRNDGLLEEVVARYPSAFSLEMETFHLLDLARASRGSVRATACAVVLAERHTNAFIESARVPALEHAAGTACLRALLSTQLAQDASTGAAAHPGISYVWA